MIIGSLPAWLDSESYLMLKESTDTKYLEILKKNKHFYEGYDKIIAKFESIVYIVDNFEDDTIDYPKIFDNMRI